MFSKKVIVVSHLSLQFYSARICYHNVCKCIFFDYVNLQTQCPCYNRVDVFARKHRIFNICPGIVKTDFCPIFATQHKHNKGKTL